MSDIAAARLSTRNPKDCRAGAYDGADEGIDPRGRINSQTLRRAWQRGVLTDRPFKIPCAVTPFPAPARIYPDKCRNPA